MKKEVSMPNFVKLEEDIVKYWEDNHVFEKLKEKNKGSKKYYAFLDGPITANNAMGIHHVWGRTLKDMYIKFKAMCGYDQKYQNGFDAHGLPVETAVEKELGINNKKDILNYGLDNFVERCLERVQKYAGVITEQSKRLGQLMDWDNSYFTNADSNITAIWHFLKKCFDNGWLYKSAKPMQWCPRCGTSLSEHEMHGSYKDIEHQAVFFKAPLKDENKAIVVWTTTPWTLSSNVAVAVNPENDYVEAKVKSTDQLLIVGKEAVKGVLKGDLIEIVREFKGSELVGKVYETCFPELEVQDFEHTVVAWEDVSATDGTGAVHIAPGCGVEDFELGRRLGLKEICPIDDNGIMLPNFGVLAGKSTKEVRDVVFEELTKRNKMYYTHAFKHSYPICWRCKEEIVFRLVDGWFIKVSEFRQQLLDAIEEVEFEPAFMKKRMVDWLNNMGDWNISRSRFYGIPLPIYVCDCGHIHTVGSLEELAELSSKEEVDALPHIHRPHIDKIEINCPKCGKKVKRITEVGDCWLDAGITPISTNNYFTNREEYEQNSPSDVVIEMREQIRLWFYSMLVMGVVVEGKAPYKKIVAYESVVQEDGSKFSKSGFMIRFDEFAGKLGADVARYMFAGNSLNSSIRFGYTLGEDARRRLLGFWNAYTFFNTYACIDNPDIASFKPSEDDLSVTDKWLIQITNNFIKSSKENYEKHNSAQVVKDFENLIDELTNFYIRVNRRRFWKSEDESDKLTAYYCLYHALKSIALVMAPIIPFMCEHIWQGLVREVEKDMPISLFLHGFAEPITEFNFEKYVGYVELVQSIITLGSRLRNENQLKVKQPLAKAYIVSDNADALEVVSTFQTVIKDELNIKDIVVTNSVEDFNDYYLTVNFKNAGMVLKGEVQKLKATLENATADEMKKYVAEFDNGKVVVAPFGELDSNNFIRNSKPKTEFVLASENNVTVVLDTTLTQELINEGILREIIRNAQILRKEANFNIEDRVNLALVSNDAEINEVVLQNCDKIKQEVLAVTFNAEFEPEIERTVEVGNTNITIKLSRV